LFIAKQRKLAFGFLGRLATEFDIVLNTVLVAVKFDLRLREGRERHHADRHER
jgi:hypothetical protein